MNFTKLVGFLLVSNKKVQHFENSHSILWKWVGFWKSLTGIGTLPDICNPPEGLSEGNGRTQPLSQVAFEWMGRYLNGPR